MFVRPVGPVPARIMIVGEAPGEEEEVRGEPFVGPSGQELSRMLHEAGIMRSECFVTNVARVRPFRNDISNFIAFRKKDRTDQHVQLRDKWVTRELREGYDLLQQEIQAVQPNVIIAFGNVAMWALTGQWGITDWRGSMLFCDQLKLADGSSPKVIPVYHPAAILRQWSWRQVAIHDLKRVAKAANDRVITPPSYRFIISPSFETVSATLAYLQSRVESGPLRLAVDIETRAGHMACVGMAWSKLDAMCIPLMAAHRPDGHYWSAEEESAIAFACYKLLTHPNAQIIGQNFLYDAQYFWRHWHFVPRFLRDTMIGHHACFSNQPKSLDFLSSLYCDWHVYWKDEGKEWDAHTGEQQLWAYNCKDCVITYEVDDGVQATVDHLGLRKVHDFQQSLFWPVLETMNRGLRVDSKRRATFSFELQAELTKREAWLQSVLGYPLNPRSTAQMQDLFYSQLKQPVQLDRKTRKPTCNDEALSKLAKREPLLRPLVRKIAEIRSIGVFHSTFVTAPTDIDGRMRCSFNPAGTETYRFSSSKNAFWSGMNLQNIPKGGGDDATPGEEEPLELPNVRTLFVPDPGMEFFDIDLSSADLRIVVWESDETEMKAMLRAGLDPYTEIAKEFYRDNRITKKDPRRQKFKSFCHGTNYLGTPKGLADRLGLSVHEAERTQAWYFSRFPRIKKWQDDLKHQVLKRRWIQNAFGYRLNIFDRVEGTVFNQCAAWIPQSSVGILINHAYLNIYNNLKSVQILLQVHDSLAGQYPVHLAPWCRSEIVKQASITIPYDDPLVIPVGIKYSTASWGDC